MDDDARNQRKKNKHQMHWQVISQSLNLGSEEMLIKKYLQLAGDILLL